MATQKTSKIPLPKSWTDLVRSAVLHVIALAQYATVYTRSWAANSRNMRVRALARHLADCKSISAPPSPIHRPVQNSTACC